MTITELVKILMVEQGRKQNYLMDILESSSPSTLSTKLGKNRWSVKDLVKTFDALGGELVVKIGEREIKITEDMLN